MNSYEKAVKMSSAFALVHEKKSFSVASFLSIWVCDCDEGEQVPSRELA